MSLTWRPREIKPIVAGSPVAVSRHLKNRDFRRGCQIAALRRSGTFRRTPTEFPHPRGRRGPTGGITGLPSLPASCRLDQDAPPMAGRPVVRCSRPDLLRWFTLSLFIAGPAALSGDSAASNACVVPTPPTCCARRPTALTRTSTALKIRITGRSRYIRERVASVELCEDSSRCRQRGLRSSSMNRPR
jgi:hypothetical protein